jgi:restriction system protein
MSVPAFQELFLPILSYLSDGRERTKKELAEHLARQFKLTQEDLSEMLPSGRQTKLHNRIAWARTYFDRSLLIETTGRGWFRITNRGRDLLATNPTSLDIKSLQHFPEFIDFQQKNKNDAKEKVTNNIQIVASEETPEERLDSSYQLLRKELADLLHEQIFNASPSFFEQLVVDVLVAMGYGGSRADAGKAIGQSGDEGIDGIIKEDRLGLDLIYLQAKRWQNPVGRPHVQSFVGSLVGKGAHKGVMLTASRFTPEAREYVRHLAQKVVLIDGGELAELMIEFNVGVNPSTTYTVKKLDTDYFEEA